MKVCNVKVIEVDPQGPDATALLMEAVAEARELYPELHQAGAPFPFNSPTPTGGIYLIAYVHGVPVACGALRPLDERNVEVRRMFVSKTARRNGLGTIMLEELEAVATRMGYRTMKLETGYRQAPAVALYTGYGFERIEGFGEHVNDPNSLCFQKALEPN